MYRNIMKCGEMNNEMTLFHTMGPNRNVLLQTHLLFVTIYMVSCGVLLTGDYALAFQCDIGYATSLYLVMDILYSFVMAHYWHLPRK